MDDECASGVDERGIVLEALPIGLGGAVDVEVVGVGGGDDGNVGRQLVERAVILVGFDDHVVALVGEQQVGAIVLRDATEESGGAHV